MLTLDIEKTGDVAVVRCAGRIVRGAEIEQLQNAVVSAKQIRIVVLDLSEVDTLDAGGLSGLLSLRDWALARKVQFKLVNPSHFVNEVLTRTGLDRVFEISEFRHALFVLGAPDCCHPKYAAGY
jgi:anti-anti-sigma factor